MTRILVIRACAIGDFILNIPALEALLLRENHDVRFTLVGYPSTLELAREFLPAQSIDAIFSIETPPWSRLFHAPADALEFDSAIVWMKDPALAQNLRASGIDQVLRANPFPVAGHAADHLLETLGLSAPLLPDKWSPLKNQILLHPGSGSPRKCWPYFNELGDRIADMGTGAFGFRNADFGLREPAPNPKSAFRNPKSPVPVSPSFLIGPAEEHFETHLTRLEGMSLRQVAGELRTCRAYVGNDSGITHLAAYLGVPTIALFGPTDPGIWGPRGRRVQTIHKPTLAEISVEDVLQCLA